MIRLLTSFIKWENNLYVGKFWKYALNKIIIIMSIFKQRKSQFWLGAHWKVFIVHVGGKGDKLDTTLFFYRMQIASGSNIKTGKRRFLFFFFPFFARARRPDRQRSITQQLTKEVSWFNVVFVERKEKEEIVECIQELFCPRRRRCASHVSINFHSCLYP